MHELIKHITGKSGLIILLLITLLSQTAFSQSNWFWIQPKPQGNRITSIEFADRNNGCAVGDVGTIVRTTNGGQTWFTVPSPRAVDLYGVDFAKGNPNILVAVGDSGRILRSSNGGNNWYIVNTFPGVIFQDFDFATSTDGYAVGLAGKIYKTTNAGQTWAQQFSPSAASFRSVNFHDANYGIIGGDRRIMLTSNGGVNWFVQNLNFATFDQCIGVSQLDSVTAIGAVLYDLGGKCYRTTTGGARWDTVYLNIPRQFGGYEILRHMSFGSENNGLITCDLGNILRTTNAGVSWRIDSSFVQYYQRDPGIGIFWTTCWADTVSAYVAGGGGNILKSSNSGQNWNFAVGGYYDLYGTYFINPYTGWVVGEEGNIQKTTNGGQSWSFYQPVTREILREVMFSSADTGYISGDSGVVLKTTNAGNSWFHLNSGTRINLFDIFFINNKTGFIGGGFTSAPDPGVGIIRKTSDGGQNWTTLFYATDSGWVNEIQFFNENTGVACFDRRITRTSNGGLNWSVVASSSGGQGIAMHFPDSQTGYVMGPVYRVYKSTNQGQDWISLNSGFFGVIQSVSFANVMTGYAVGYDGILIQTTNGGVNWSSGNTVTSSDLLDVYLVDTLNGYISGGFGNILKTTTGGITSVFSFTEAVLPGTHELYQNYPNPFNPRTRISFTLGSRASVQLIVYDLLGREVRTLAGGTMEAGKHNAVFEASELPSGVYFCSLKINNSLFKTIKLLLTK